MLVVNLLCYGYKQNISRSVWINMAIVFQAGQPLPASRTNKLEILQAGVPTVKKDKLRLKSPLASYLQHGAEVIILGQAIFYFIIDAAVYWNMSFAVSQHHREKINP